MADSRYTVSMWDGNGWTYSEYEDVELAINTLHDRVGPQGMHRGEVFDNEKDEIIDRARR